MRIESFRVHWWLSVLFATSVAAGLSAIESPVAALLAGLAALATSALTLTAAWLKRDRADAFFFQAEDGIRDVR